MHAYREFTYRGTSGTDIHDVTGDVRRTVAEAGVEDGLVSVFAPGSTAAVTTIEYESGVLDDLRRALEEIAPQAGRYDHDARWGDGNGYAHVRAALLGPGITIPVHEGSLVLGTWQQVVLLDFDNRARDRLLAVTVLGDSGLAGAGPRP